MMSSGTKRTRDAEATALGSRPATGSQPLPPRILVADARPPHWALTCPKLCEALENVFCLACSLGGPPRLPLFSLYVAQKQHECLLPFVGGRWSWWLWCCLSKMMTKSTTSGALHASLPSGRASLAGPHPWHALLGLRPGSLLWPPLHLRCHKLLPKAYSLLCVSWPSLSCELLSLLPPQPVKGSFARLQSCLAELRAVPSEGAFRPGEDAVAQAVRDGLQQFKQYTGQGMAGAPLSSCGIEVTVVTSQLSTEVARQLERRLRGTDLVSLRQLQVVEIAPGGLQAVPAAGGGNSSRESPVEEEEAAFAVSGLLGPEVDLQTVENEVVALEGFFKAWLQDPGGEQEHLHLLLPAPLGGSLACVKCDVQERLLNPALLPPVGTTRDNGARANSANADCFWMTPRPGLAPHRLRVLRALRAEGVCASLLFGLPLIVRPTSCWRLTWDELEANQHRFQALCRGLRNREWLLLARHEPHEGPGPRREPPASVASHWALLPAASCSSLLLRALVPRELLLPGPCPVLPAEPPEAALRDMEGILEGLEVEMSFDPLRLGSHLYRVLRTSLARPLASRPPVRPAERHLPRQAGRQHPSRARATVAPLHLTPAAPSANQVTLSLFSAEEEEFLDAV